MLKISEWTEDLTIVSKQASEARLKSILVKRQRKLKGKNGEICEKYVGKKAKDDQAKQKQAYIRPYLKIGMI